MSIDPQRQSFNNGFWDGWHDAEAQRKPLWDGQEHPNVDYGVGYKYGKDKYNIGVPESSDDAWADWQRFQEQVSQMIKNSCENNP